MIEMTSKKDHKGRVMGLDDDLGSLTMTIFVGPLAWRPRLLARLSGRLPPRHLPTRELFGFCGNDSDAEPL